MYFLHLELTFTPHYIITDKGLDWSIPPHQLVLLPSFYKYLINDITTLVTDWSIPPHQLEDPLTTSSALVSDW